MTSGSIFKEAILRYAKFLARSGKRLDTAQRREVLEAFVSRIVIQTNGEFEIVFMFPVDSEIPSVESPLNPPFTSPYLNDSLGHTRVLVGGAAATLECLYLEFVVR